MKKTLLVVVCCFGLCWSLSGCAVHQHNFGSGPHQGVEETYGQWYTLAGFVPVGEIIDGGQIAASPNCRITTKYGPLDCLLFPVSLFISRRTIVVEK